MCHSSDKPHDCIYKGQVAADPCGDDTNWSSGYRVSEEFVTSSNGAHKIFDVISVLCFNKIDDVYISC